ncbi:MAG: PQQ-binding-like beta-propeller repeat protein, partial [Planctomycetota bacterium]|nr:PQQ-binding-like beta-propeller repeat protein [Planctomycetota bacterium]
HHNDESTIPTIAWQIGDGQSFSYDPVANVESLEHAGISGAATTVGTDIDTIEVHEDGSVPFDRPWSGHRFLSPPTGHGTNLFVLTLNESQIFLNCLQRNTGDLLWRQPLIYIDENAPSFIDTSLFAKRTSTCIVSGDTVVCSLADGILIGVRAVDGTLLWATAIRDKMPALPQFRFGRSEPIEEQEILSPSILVPCIADGIVVCCNHASLSLYAVSLQNGEILWKSSRRAFGAGEVGGSPDYYVAGICGNQIILVGDRHCRSVDLKSGDQNWAVQTPASSGRAACSGNRCVIPVRFGQAVLVDLSSGTLITPSFVELPKDSMNQYGAMIGDEELICAATPTTVAVFSRVDALLNSADRLPSLTSNPTKRVLIQAQAHLINGDVDASRELLMEAVAARTSDTESVSQIDEFLAELILQQWGKAIADACEGRQARILSGSTERYSIVPSEIVIPPDTAILSKLKLPKNVEFRTAVFDLLSDLSVDGRKPALKQLRQYRDWATPIRLTNLWSVRPELLFDLPDIDSIPAVRDLDEFSIEELKRLADHVLQNPGLISDDVERERLVGRLIRRGEFASAELLLIRWREAFDEANNVHDNQAMELLKQIRLAWIEQPAVSEITGVTSEVSAPLTFELLPFMQNLDADFDAMQRQVWVDFLPVHRKMQIYLSQQPENKAKLLSIDPADGSARDEVKIPFSIDRVAGWYEPLSDGVLTPSLFPVCGTNEMAMMSCSVPGKARSLWTRRFRNGEKDVLRVEFGALGSDHFIWQFADKLHCSDPLTGDDLWTRALTLSHSDQTILHRGTNPSVRRIAGDRRATIVMGSDSRSYECFNTRDGRRLSSGRLNIGRSESVVAVGRCLLYADANARLHLFDSASGKDELDDDDPISPLSRDDKTVCQVLENNRVQVVSSTMELILIDVDQGRVVFRIPASKYVKSGFVFSFSAFERHGRLFAALSGEGRSGRSIQQAFMRGSPYLSNGPLLCLNPLTGEVQWSVNVDQGIFPDIHGDPTDLLISWSSPKPSLDLNPGYQAENKLIVEVYDESTGQLIAQSPVFSSLPPVRCVHLADENLFRLTTPNATVSIRAPSID